MKNIITLRTLFQIVGYGVCECVLGGGERKRKMKIE